MRLKREPACAENNRHCMSVELIKVREWAQDQLDAEHEAPWATRRYLHVVVLIDRMLASRAATPPRAGNVVHLDFSQRPGIRK
jgi:hypothetical protein